MRRMKKSLYLPTFLLVALAAMDVIAGCAGGGDDPSLNPQPLPPVQNPPEGRGSGTTEPAPFEDGDKTTPVIGGGSTSSGSTSSSSGGLSPTPDGGVE